MLSGFRSELRWFMLGWWPPVALPIWAVTSDGRRTVGAPTRLAGVESPGPTPQTRAPGSELVHPESAGLYLIFPDPGLYVMLGTLLPAVQCTDGRCRVWGRLFSFSQTNLGRR